MRYGFVKVASATPEIRVADVQYNAEQILRLIKTAEEKEVQLLVFPELCLTGYTCGELFQQSVLLNGANSALKDIIAATKTLKMLVFVGMPVLSNGALYNCAAAIGNGKLLSFVPKSYLPNYAEFYERRNFAAFDGTMRSIEWEGEVIPFGANILFCDCNQKNFSVSAEICEDLWVPAPPSVSHALAGAHIIANLSASNETAGKADYRRLLVKSQSAKTVSGYVYADAGDGESTTDLVFSGHNIVAENGEILAESKLFENGLTISEIDVDKIAFERRRINTFTDSRSFDHYAKVFFDASRNGEKLTRAISSHPFIPEGAQNVSERAELILSMQAAGLKKRISHMNAATAVIGISGGLDSALALLVTVRAFTSLGKNLSDIIAVTMPCFGTTDKTYGNSLRLMHALGVTSRIVPVKDAVLQHFKDISHDEKVKNAAYENSQARIRTLVLMDIANDNGGLVIGTGDLSELALGWATYNGDHMSMYGVNSSVPKTLVKYLVSYEAQRLGGEAFQVLTDILNTEISPELLPPENGKIAQKTEELVGPYELHDFYLYHAIRWGEPPEKVLYLAEYAFNGVYDKSTLKKWLRAFYKRFFSQQFKRSCLPDGVKIGSVALSPRGDWRMPSDACVSLWLQALENL